MDQRVYYFNTKEIVGNKYGTTNPIPFRVVDRNIGLDVDIAIRCNGEFSYRIADPLLFYKNVCGNVADVYRRSEIDSMLRTELLTALQPAFAAISEQGVRYSALPGHAGEIAGFLNQALSQKWKNLRGLTVSPLHQLRKRLPGGRSHDQRSCNAPPSCGIPPWPLPPWLAPRARP